MFDLKTYLKNRQELINSELDKEIPPETDTPTLLHQAIRYSLFSGGKRIRPIMCLAAAEAVGASLDCALLPALSIELLHSYTLIHDDLPSMDDDDFRRGKPSCHKKFDEATAILAGDALQAMSFGLLAKTIPPAPYQPNQLIKELAQAAGNKGVVGGQVEDLAFSESEPTPEALDFIHLHKTADLFNASTRIGAISAGANEKELEALSKYGVNIGLAFQITDDLLDAEEKNDDNATCLAVLDPEAARNKAELLINNAISALSIFEETNTEPLIAIAKYILERKF